LKTATITYHKVYNYGALLQAYALQQAQLKLSIDNVIIDYSSEKNKVYKKIKGKSLKILLVNTLRLLETLANLPAIRRRCQKFQNFSNQNLFLTPRYYTFKELQKNPPNADWYIAGSNQLWNVSTLLRKEFFLDFGGDEVKRASYAVSMGSYEVSNNYQEQFRELVNRFDAISVREIEAKEYIEKLIDKEVDVKLNFDPVFLLSKEEWSKFAIGKRIRNKYILCYPLSGHPLIQSAINRLKQLTGYPIVIISTELFTHIKGDVTIRDATPQEFVALVKNAEYVLTSSFHGTVFACIFNTKFYSFVGGTAPTRITGVLKCLKLEHRIADSIEEVNTNEIDFTEANHIIKKEKESSQDYLRSLLVTPKPNIPN